MIFEIKYKHIRSFQKYTLPHLFMWMGSYLFIFSWKRTKATTTCWGWIFLFLDLHFQVSNHRCGKEINFPCSLNKSHKKYQDQYFAWSLCHKVVTEGKRQWIASVMMRSLHCPAHAADSAAEHDFSCQFHSALYKGKPKLMRNISFFDITDLICHVLLPGLYGYWSFLEQCKKPKLHPDLLASESLNHRMERSRRLEGGSLAAAEEHPSYPQYLLMERLWELSTESVCLIWVELGALLQIHGVLVNLPVEGHTSEILPCFSCRSVVWKTCREGWMSVGLMLLRYDWFRYTLEWDKIPH